MGRKIVLENDVLKFVSLGGVNMAFRKELLSKCPLAQLYKRSRKGLWNEQILAYCVKKTGYDTYEIRGSKCSPLSTLYMNNRLLEARDFGTNFGYTMIAQLTTAKESRHQRLFHSIPYSLYRNSS
jgi:hypothetical protein